MKAKTLLFGVALLLLSSLPALAVGLGGYVDLAGGSGTFDEDGGDDFDNDVTAFGVGFALDTGVRGAHVFNYRLHAGLEAMTLSDDYDQDLNLSGFVVDNIFGFALTGNDRFRLWAGPEVRLAYYSGELDNIDDNTTNEYTAEMSAFGLGAVIGANIAVGRNFNICPMMGLRWTTYSGTYEVDTDYGDYDGDIEGDTTVFFIGADFLFGN